MLMDYHRLFARAYSQQGMPTERARCQHQLQLLQLFRLERDWMCWHE
jgi:hypothetical protein